MSRLAIDSDDCPVADQQPRGFSISIQHKWQTVFGEGLVLKQDNQLRVQKGKACFLERHTLTQLLYALPKNRCGNFIGTRSGAFIALAEYAQR